jgi:precorrin-2 dehydrogenase/sirohydrochlorin ferrochelatase
MKLYAAFLNLKGRRCVVVGGGRVAERKAAALVAAGARVRVVSPQLTRRLAAWARRKRIEVRKRRYRRGDLRGALLAFAATNDPGAQRAVAAEARRAGVPINLADDAEKSGFLVPATFGHGDVRVAISTSGASPALARLLKAQLQSSLGRDTRRALSALRRAREHAQRSIPSRNDRARFFRRLAASVVTGRPRRRRRKSGARRVFERFGIETR